MRYTTSLVRRWRLAAILFASCFFVVGCALDRPVLSDSNHLHGPGLNEPFADSAMVIWPADPSRLDVDIRRAFRDLNWGRMYIRKNNTIQGLIVRAAGLLPDGRTVTIVAWPIADDRVAVGLRVGQFGDRDREQRFVNMLAKLLAGKPAPVRGGTFELP